MAKTWTQNKRFQRTVNALFAKLHRLRKGKLAAGTMSSLLLHTTGAKSGTARLSPLMYLDLGGDLGAGDGRIAIGCLRCSSWSLRRKLRNGQARQGRAPTHGSAQLAKHVLWQPE